MSIGLTVREQALVCVNSIREGNDRFSRVCRHITPQPQLVGFCPPNHPRVFSSSYKWLLVEVYVEGRNHYAVTTYCKTLTFTTLLPYFARTMDDAERYLDFTKDVYARAYEKGLKSKQDEIKRALGLGDM